jgi:hypothetical protein
MLSAAACRGAVSLTSWSVILPTSHEAYETKMNARQERGQLPPALPPGTEATFVVSSNRLSSESAVHRVIGWQKGTINLLINRFNFLQASIALQIHDRRLFPETCACSSVRLHAPASLLRKPNL